MHLASDWGALQRWRQPAEFLREFGQLSRLVRWPGGANQLGILSRRASIEQYMGSMGAPSAGLLFDSAVGEGVDWDVPAELRRHGLNDTILSVGPDGVGLPFHNHASAWQTVVTGRKLFVLLPPMSTGEGSWIQHDEGFVDVLAELLLQSPATLLPAGRLAALLCVVQRRSLAPSRPARPCPAHHLSARPQ